VRLVDELHESARVTDTPWAALAERFGPDRCLELPVLVGWYHLVAFVANGAAVALEPWAARFPDGRRRRLTGLAHVPAWREEPGRTDGRWH
jgi:hypothetical protein